MDLLQECPRNEARETIQNAAVAAFGITLQGESHKQSTPPTPCQDYHALRWMENEGIFLAASADGVGSCRRSHWGAFTAVNAALDRVEKEITALAKGRRLQLDAESGTFRKQMKEIMLSAFRTAPEAVEQLADSADPPQQVFAFQSTLTLASYDGTCLYHGHAGDDGIVAQLPDGTVETATRRMKGEEASSVYPLQSGETAWSFGLVPEVAGFVMATDGVLDAFVQSHSDYYGINYCNGICYAFMEDAMKQLAQQSTNAAEAAMEQYLHFLQSEEYTQRVTDDLTLVAVVSPKLMAKAKQPDFSLEIWNTIAQESLNAKRRALNHRAAREANRPVHAPVLPEEPELALPQEEPAASFFSQIPEEKEPEHHVAPMNLLLMVLALVAALLLGLLLGKLISSYRHGKEYEALSQQYCTLSQAYDALTINCTALEQAAQEAQSRAEDAERELESQKQLLENRQQELEVLRQRISVLESPPEPEQTERNGTQEAPPAMSGIQNTAHGTSENK